MNRLILQMQISIDGYVSGATPWQVWNWGDDWTWDADLRGTFNATVAGAGGILLSRPMAMEGYLDHWAGMAERHAGDPDFAFAGRVGAVPKFIVSNRLDQTPRPDCRLMTGPFAEAVTTAKHEAPGDLITFGGTGFARALLAHGLFDELQLYVNPVALGSGDALFVGGPQRFDLVDARPYACGIVVQTYRPAS